MAITITLEGIQSFDNKENRALAYLGVNLNDTEYKWQTFVPPYATDLETFIESIKPRIEAEILEKEAAWEALDPKTKTYFDIMSNQERTVPVQKEEIVRPDVPDYYALRRNEYPPVLDQLGALWKGYASQEYNDMIEKIQEVKNKYPKTYLTPEELQQQQAELTQKFIDATQKRLDDFARTRNYDGILSACTYENSPVPKFATEGQYCVQMRALTWAAMYEILGEVQSGTRPVPTSFADIEGDLPALVWPN